MSNQDVADPSAVGEPPEPGSRKFGPAKIAAALVFLALAGFWIWIFIYQLQNKGEDDMLDRLDDLTWTSEAEIICQGARDDIATLPVAHSASDVNERADVINVATDRVEQMLVQLEAIAPTGTTRDARITKAWFEDYRVFLKDRRDFAQTIRQDPAARFLVTEKYGSHITKPLDRFARVNEMEACMTPGDV